MKTKSRPQYYRIRGMLQMIRDGVSSGILPNSSDFMREFGVSRRTVARDLDFLRDEERAPIEYNESRHGYHLADETFSLPPITISRKEAFSFGLARKLLSHYETTPMHMDIRSVLDKIAESLEGDITIEPGWLSEHVDVLPEDCVSIDPQSWTQFVRFVEHREAVRADYQSFAGRISRYELHPYHLLAYRGNWYVLARNAAKDLISTFALSRFRSIEPLGRTFSRPADFDVKNYIGQAFGIMGGDVPLEVRLLFEPNLAVYITERQWHPSQAFLVRPDGRVEMRMVTTGRKEVVRWILSWMPDVKVLAPESLRNRIMEKLRKGLRAQA